MAGLPFLLIGVPFALLFGVVATEAGLSVAQTLGFSILVIAGASQFTAIQLMIENAPVFIVLAAALAVNLRMAMYSASLQPHLGGASLPQRALAAYVNVDAAYALGILKFEEEPDWSPKDKFLYFVGTMALMFPLWVVGTWVGAVAGDALPEKFDLEFAMPIMFLALTAPLVKTLAHLGTAVTSVVGALLLSFLPSGIGILLAGLVAMAVGAEIERRRT
ncbi:MAG: AzlC family ABC transporter permease [Silicimonas sp.]|nr:AzlC family ABC transporter permease [Silicimonas sp.]